MSLSSRTYVLAMNKDAYDRLPRDLKTVLDANSNALAAGMAGAMWDLQAAAVAENVAERGDVIVTLLPEAVAHWRRETEPVVTAWLKDMKEQQGRRRQADRERARAVGKIRRLAGAATVAGSAAAGAGSRRRSRSQVRSQQVRKPRPRRRRRRKWTPPRPRRPSQNLRRRRRRRRRRRMLPPALRRPPLHLRRNYPPHGPPRPPRRRHRRSSLFWRRRHRRRQHRPRPQHCRRRRRWIFRSSF